MKTIHTYLQKTLRFNVLLILSFIAHFSFGQKENPIKPELRNLYQTELQKKSSEIQYVDFVVKSKSPEAKAFLEQNGAKIKFERGNLISARIPLDKIEAIGKSTLIYPLQFSLERGVELNDTMRLLTRVNPVHQGVAPLNKMYDGEDVIIGFIDSGIDYTHPDFQNPDGSTRVLALWDQTKGFDATFTPSQYGYGQVWDSAQINAGIATHDLLGTAHGSTVAGAASGNGLASGTHAGVAPKSDIIMVETNFSLPNWFATVVDAVDYIFSVADYYGKPCVINASVGGYFGSHDGLDVEALMIDDLINEKPGRLLVCAGGNSGLLAPYHVRNEVSADTTFTWFTINPSSAFGFPAGYILIWADKDKFDDVHFAIGADKISPNFEFRGRTDFKNVIADNMVDAMTTDAIEVGGNTLANIEYYITEDNDRYEIVVYIPQPDSADYYYRFMATSSSNGLYDMWASSAFRVSSLIKDGLPSVSDFPDIQYYIAPDTLQSIVTSWACSPNVITVANYNSVDRYVDYNGNVQLINDIPRELNLTSSKGPTRTGLIKPDIGATGATTFSAGVVVDIMNRRTNDPTNLQKSGWHVPNGGTSMASPVVAGVGALLLQRCPNLTPQKFKEIITSTAFKDAYTGSSLPDNAWGYGKVDAFAAVVSTLLPKPSITVVGTSLMASMASGYQWYKDGEPINGETSQILNDFDVAADYMVEIFNEFGCSSFSDPSSGLGVLVVGKDFKLYPNPTNDLINIDFDLSTNPKSLTIVDVLGRELKTINTLKLTNTIDVSDLDAGVYFMLIKNQNEQLSKVSFIKH